MQRGFPAAAKVLALEVRAEIGLDAHAPFNPYALAAEYGIKVVRLSELPCEERRRFLRPSGSPFSGALIPDGTGRVILENDAQPLTRRRTTMCHEIAHVVLENDFTISLAAEERKCGLGGGQEEADWLSGELLLPYDGAMRLAWQEATDGDAAAAFEVSFAVARWRMNHSGARTVVQRTRAKWSKTTRPRNAPNRSGPRQTS